MPLVFRQTDLYLGPLPGMYGLQHCWQTLQPLVGLHSFDLLEHWSLTQASQAGPSVIYVLQHFSQTLQVFAGLHSFAVAFVANASAINTPWGVTKRLQSTPDTRIPTRREQQPRQLHRLSTPTSRIEQTLHQKQLG